MQQLLAVIVACFIVACGTAEKAAAGQFDDIITPADVQNVTGLTGVKQVARDQS